MAIVFRFAGSQTQVLQFLHSRKARNNCFKICTSKNKELKTSVINTYKKMGEGWPVSLCRGQRLSESVCRPDEAVGDVI